MDVQRMFDNVRGGYTEERACALLSDAAKRELPLTAYDIVQCGDENTGVRYGQARCRRGFAVKLGGGGRNRGEQGYQVWAVVKPEFRSNS